MKISQTHSNGAPQPAPLRNGRKTPEVWYLLANGHDAVVFRKDGPHLEQVADIIPTNEFIPTEAQRNRGHIKGGQGGIHYTSNPMDRERDHDEEIFLKNVAGWIGKACHDNMFDRLVIAAAPNALGLLRDALDSKVKDKVVKEIAKDYTNTPLNEIEALIN